LLFSAVISEHFSKNRVIIYVVAAKIWYLKNVLFLLGHTVLKKEIVTVLCNSSCHLCTNVETSQYLSVTCFAGGLW